MMFKLLITTACLLLAIPGEMMAKSANHNVVTLTEGLEQILSRARPDANIGMIVRDAKTNQVIYSRQSQHLFSPASTQKLFTAVAALSYLGADFRYPTTLLTHGTIKDHTLLGDLTIQFSGDPEFTVEDLNSLIAQLKKQGIQHIAGHVYIDHSAYGGVPYPPGWMWDDLSYSYAAPLDAIIIDQNKFV